MLAVAMLRPLTVAWVPPHLSCCNHIGHTCVWYSYSHIAFFEYGLLVLGTACTGASQPMFIYALTYVVDAIVHATCASNDVAGPNSDQLHYGTFAAAVTRQWQGSGKAPSTCLKVKDTRRCDLGSRQPLTQSALRWGM